MRGERCESLELGPHGAAGDRQYAVSDAQGPVSAKRVAALLNFSVLEGKVLFPDGRQSAFDDPGIHEALSGVLGFKARLVKGQTPVYDAEPIHIVTTASLAWAQADERRFRPNLVIDAPGEGYLERAWIGRRLRVGGAALEVIRPTGRCVMVTLPQAELPRQAPLLRALESDGDALFGVYAEVLSPGTVRAGDSVSFEAT
jgi:uncharacterized protein YcbX